MKNKKILHFANTAAFLLILVTMLPASDKNIMKIWYTKPAAEWVEALPIGNGRLAAMIYGGVPNEKIQFNEETLWTGEPHDYQNEGAVNYLDTVRQLLFEGKQIEAQDIASDHMMSIPLHQKAYQPFGDISIQFKDHDNYQNYRRELDLENALSTVSYEVGNVRYTRTYLASYPDQVIAIHLAADKKASVNCSIHFTSPHENFNTKVLDKTMLALSVSIRDGVLKGEALLKILTSGGESDINENKIIIRNADTVTIYLVAATNYINFRDVSANPKRRCQEYLENINDKPFSDIYQTHVRDYCSLFNRLNVDFGSSEAMNQPTNLRLKNFKTVSDPQFLALYMQYGRYLLIASSRPGTQPANLQGIWNDLLNPPWDSKWTTNINLEMNYWPAELCNLSQCHEPLFDMIDDLVITGRQTARAHYGCRGWVLHHNTDIWRGTAPVNASNHGIWVTGGAWLCQHLWEHFLFTQDTAFLEERAYPIMKEAAIFFTDFLIEDPKTGWLISTPSNSPEIGGLVAGPTMDHQIIRSLFRNCITVTEILERDDSFRTILQGLVKRIAPNQIGKYGQLQEWLEDKDDPENRHRHVSHLWAVYPGNEINLRGTRDLIKAARQSLLFRGDGGTGWSLAWKINLWARMGDGNHAFKIIKTLLTPVEKDHSDTYIRGGTYANLFDAHPPFQIDGNFGATAGIAELLLQSHSGEIEILPALPSALPRGHVEGLCARGGFELDISWQNGKLVNLTILSKKGNSSILRYDEKVILIKTKTGEKLKFDNNLQRLDL